MTFTWLPPMDTPPGPIGRPSYKGSAGIGQFSLRRKGTVVVPPDEHGNVRVQVGILQVHASLTDLERTREELVTLTRFVPARPTIHTPVPAELHLRGLRVEPAVYELDRYLDQAALAGHAEVRIVHGKGTGAVRSAVHDRLREHPLVKSFRPGEEGEGDSGVTVVELG